MDEKKELDEQQTRDLSFTGRVVDTILTVVARFRLVKETTSVATYWSIQKRG